MLQQGDHIKERSQLIRRVVSAALKSAGIKYSIESEAAITQSGDGTLQPYIVWRDGGVHTFYGNGYRQGRAMSAPEFVGQVPGMNAFLPLEHRDGLYKGAHTRQDFQHIIDLADAAGWTVCPNFRANPLDWNLVHVRKGSVGNRIYGGSTNKTLYFHNFVLRMMATIDAEGGTIKPVGDAAAAPLIDPIQVLRRKIEILRGGKPIEDTNVVDPEPDNSPF